MIKQFHAKPNSNRSSKESEKKKCLFFRSPFTFSRLSFIMTKQEEREKIKYENNH